MGVTRELLTGCAVAFVTTEYSRGEKIRTVMPICTARAMACEGPKALSLDQMSFTLTGWLVTLRGGSLGGEIRSRRFCHMTLYGDCQSTVMREDTALGVGLNHSLKFSATPPPYSSTVNTSPLTFLAIFTGR